MYFVFGYSVFWILFLIYLIIHKREYRKFIYIIFIWTLSSIASIIYYFAVPYNFTEIRIIPYIFLILCLLISFYPFYTRDDSIKQISIGNEKLFNKMIIAIGIISILPFFENLIHIISTYGATNTDTIADVYEEKMSGDFNRSQFINWFSLPGRICNSINLKFQYCSLFLLFTYLCLSNKKKVYIILLSLCALNPVLYQLGMSGRSTLVFLFLRSILLFFIFRCFLSTNIKRLVIKYGTIILTSSILLLSVITLARYNNNAGANSISLLAWISLYVGEGSLNFNNAMWDTNTFTEGDNCFSFFKSILGLDTFTDYLERRAYWGSRTGVDPVRFYTFVGDIFSDISFFVLPLLILIVYYFRKKTASKNRVSLFTMYLYYTWGYICISGITCYTLKTYQSMIDLTFSLIVIYVLSRRSKHMLSIQIKKDYEK